MVYSISLSLPIVCHYKRPEQTTALLCVFAELIADSPAISSSQNVTGVKQVSDG